MVQEKYVLGIDIGGTNFRIGIVTDKYEVEDFKIKPSAVLQNGDFVKNLAQEIKEYLEKYENKICSNFAKSI